MHRVHHRWDSPSLNRPMELLVFGNPFTMVHGCSFGAIHAMLFGLRHPTHFNRVLAFSGYYDVHRFLEGYHDEEVHYHNPLDIVRGLQEGQLAEEIRRLDIIMAIG